jgi:hypothetical protein
MEEVKLRWKELQQPTREVDIRYACGVYFVCVPGSLFDRDWKSLGTSVARMASTGLASPSKINSASNPYNV